MACASFITETKDRFLMDMNINSDDFSFCHLGSGEIGMNANLYHYKGRWLMVDLGLAQMRARPVSMYSCGSPVY